MDERQKEALTKDLAFELYAATIGADVMEAPSRAQWVRVTWERDKHRHSYYESLAARVLALLELGANDCADPIASLGTSLWVLGAGLGAAKERG